VDKLRVPTANIIASPTTAIPYASAGVICNGFLINADNVSKGALASYVVGQKDSGRPSCAHLQFCKP
jgi:hypothetical protein